MDFEEHPLYAWLSEFRRDIHRHPETANQESRTTAKLKDLLESLSVPAEIPQGMQTGLVGLLQGAQPGKVLALRADIDALPMEELNGAPYRSSRPGVMHACGHDGHAAIMAGVAKNLFDLNLLAQMKGAVKFLFQPAEERGTGARDMIGAGVLDDPPVDRALACHMYPYLPVGQVGLFKSASHASVDSFQFKIQGKGTHGASPHKGIDPIYAGAQLVGSLQGVIGRSLDPTETGLISVGKFQSGSAFNIIPDSALIEGTVRTMRVETQKTIEQRMAELARGLEASFGVEVELIYSKMVPPCVGDEQAAQELYHSAAKVLGEENVKWLEPSTGGEDFAYITQKVPGAFMRVGCGNQAKGLIHSLHSPYFDMDEAALPLAVEVFTQAVRDYLA